MVQRGLRDGRVGPEEALSWRIWEPEACVAPRASGDCYQGSTFREALCRQGGIFLSTEVALLGPSSVSPAPSTFLQAGVLGSKAPMQGGSDKIVKWSSRGHRALDTHRAFGDSSAQLHLSLSHCCEFKGMK